MASDMASEVSSEVSPEVSSNVASYVTSDTGRSSFGVELEFLIAVRFEKGPPPPGFERAPGRPIDCERGRSGEEVEKVIEKLLSATINEALEGHRGDRVVASAAELDVEVDNFHLWEYMEWGVKRDVSVVVDDNEWENALYWHDVEITSPALYATENSFAEVRRVINALKAKWWVFAPESAGLHVHYSRGNDYIPFEHLRRIASFLYAGDPILVQMHPERRRNQTEYCPSNRLYSGLAHGMTAQIAKGGYTEGIVDVEGEPFYPGDFAGQQPEDRETRIRAPAFPTVFKRGSLPGYEFDQNEFNLNIHPLLIRTPTKEHAPNPDRSKPLSIPIGVLEILACDNAPSISLLQNNFIWERSAYNFEAYKGSTYYNNDGSKRTIEFRQAAGTLDADEVIAYCKIAVGLADFASRTDPNELFKMALDFSDAEENPKWYDVFDLLFDVGLAEEALVIQRGRAREHGIEIIDEVGGLYQETLPPPSNPRKRRFDEMKEYVSSLFNWGRRRSSSAEDE
ncbi:putative amidoligase enzyme-domain-containing protein [Hypoxylon cercidicola]|nr:putative amidoligase enzyme-domain-containing protein [Hypoxylon cercidicola]